MAPKKISRFPRVSNNQAINIGNANPAQTMEAARLAEQGGPRTTDEDLMRRDDDSASMLPYWEKTDDFIEGLPAVKLATTKYMPKFTEEEQQEYANRILFASMTNVYRDIVESLSAKPFERETEFRADEKNKKTVPEQMQDFQEDVDGLGNSLTMFSSDLFFNGLNNAISWIFVDYPNGNENVVTLADAKAADVRPFWSVILARNVLAARYKRQNSKIWLTYFKLHEPRSEGVPDRVRIFNRNADNTVSWELWEKNSDQTQKYKFKLVDDGVLTINVIPMVPFITGRRVGRSMKIFPVLRDAIELQETLYRNESSLEYNKTISGYAMLSATGVVPELDKATNKPKRVATGPTRILYGGVNNAGTAGRWEFIQPSAEMSKFLSDDIERTIQRLRELGKQPLTAQSGNLTTITTAVAAGKSKSAVKSMCQNLKDTLENAAVITCMYYNVPVEDAPLVFVFDDFDDIIEGGDDVAALRAAREDGDLSQETYWEELQRRNVLSSEFNAERERKRQLSEVPADKRSPEDTGG